MNATTRPESMALTTKPAPAFDLSPQTFEQALTFAQYLAESDMVPKDFKGKPGNCLIAMQWGNELGMKAIQAIQNIAVINGRPALWGDAVIALVRSSPLCEYVQESDDGFAATCKVKRRGEPEQHRTFDMDDAKRAGLLGKQGPWTQYPKRMRQMRARAFALRDVFPDVLRGMPVAEEVMDIPTERNMGAAQVVPRTEPAAGLLQDANTAAAAGVAAYQAFWKSAGTENRKLLAGEHERLKALAIQADKARTVDTPAPTASPDADGVAAAPVKTFDEVMVMLCAATTEDALYTAADWIESGNSADASERAMLNDKFDERLATMRGAA